LIASGYWLTESTTTLIISMVASIPVLTASVPMSLKTALICFPTNSVGKVWIPFTPSVFWDVIEVNTEVP
jgi:hypothetical protein